MNLTLFKEALKADAINCYHDAIHSYEYNPFGNKTNIVNDIINFEIKQSLGKNALKAIISSDLTAAQLSILDKQILHYKTRTINAFIKHTKHSN